MEPRAGTPSRSIPAQPGDCTDSMGTGKWFKSSFRGARSSMRNWIGSVSASVARVVVVARKQRNTPNSPSTSAKMTEKDANT